MGSAQVFEAAGGLGSLTTELAGAVASILPVAIACFGIMMGIKLVPKLIKKFI